MMLLAFAREVPVSIQAALAAEPVALDEIVVCRSRTASCASTRTASGWARAPSPCCTTPSRLWPASTTARAAAEQGRNMVHAMGGCACHVSDDDLAAVVESREPWAADLEQVEHAGPYDPSGPSRPSAALMAAAGLADPTDPCGDYLRRMPPPGLFGADDAEADLLDRIAAEKGELP